MSDLFVKTDEPKKNAATVIEPFAAPFDATGVSAPTAALRESLFTDREPSSLCEILHGQADTLARGIRAMLTARLAL